MQNAPAVSPAPNQNAPAPQEDPAVMLQNIAKELYAKNVDLNREEARLNEILSQVVEIIFAVDQDNKITLINEVALDAFGADKSCIGRNVDEVLRIYSGDTDKPLFSRDYAFVKKNQVIDRVNVQIKHRSNRPIDPSDPIQVTQERTEVEKYYYKLLSTYIELDEGKKEAVIALSDITKEVELDKQKDEFISIASHELKTPITIVKNNLWMLQNTSKKAFSQRELRFMSEMNQGLVRLQSVIDNLLNVSRIQQGRLAFEVGEHSLKQLVLTTLDNFKELIERKGLEMKVELPFDENVVTDGPKFQEILDNFVSNAVKYTEKGQIYVFAEKFDRFYKVSVRDQGPGIEPKDYPKMFTKFGRAESGLKLKTPGASTGLGLYIAKEFAHQLGGEVGFSSRLGAGTTFWFTIPQHPPKSLMNMINNNRENVTGIIETPNKIQIDNTNQLEV